MRWRRLPSAMPTRAGPGWSAAAATATTSAAAAPAVDSPAPARNSTARAYNVAVLRQLARRTLPNGLFEFVDRATENELALHTIGAALERELFLSRVLVDVLRCSRKISLVGRPRAMPVVVAPTGAAGACASISACGPSAGPHSNLSNARASQALRP